MLIGMIDSETPIFWPPDVKGQLIRKDPDAGKDWRQQEKGTTKDEMVGWPHQLNVHDFEQTPGDGERQGSLVCWSPWGCKELDTTEQLNWTELIHGHTHTHICIHTHTMEYNSAIKEKENLAFCNNVDGTLGHSKWNKPDRERQTLYGFTYM